MPEQICNWNDAARGQCWVIAFGDWKSAPYDARNRWYACKFKNAGNTPYIENVVITMRGAPDMIERVMALPVWNQVSLALGK